MNKILKVFTLAGILTLFLGTCVMADSFYIEGMGGKWDNIFTDTTKNQKHNLGAAVIGGEFWLDPFKIRMELTSGVEGKADDGYWGVGINYTSYLLKCGYGIMESRKGDIAFTVSSYGRFWDDRQQTYVGGLFIGCDMCYDVTRHSTFETSLDYSIYSTYTSEYDQNYNYSPESYDASGLLFNIKYTSYFADEVGFSVGYRYNMFNTDDSLNTKFHQSGLTAGLAFKF